MVRTTHRSDQDIQADVRNELQDVARAGTVLTVTVTGGVVTMCGEVGTVPERLAAKWTVMRVPGVMAVADELQVRASGPPTATDADIAHLAGQLLRGAPEITSDSIKVEVRHHVITLSGIVASDDQRAAAARAVVHINGVTGVTNRIAVRWAGDG